MFGPVSPATGQVQPPPAPGGGGGLYSDPQNPLGAVNDGLDKHHIPSSASYSGSSNPSRNKKCGPAILIDPDDHSRTASNAFGQNAAKQASAKAFIDKQAALMAAGDIAGALQMDIDDIESLQRAGKLRHNYDAAIAQAKDTLTNGKLDDCNKRYPRSSAAASAPIFGVPAPEVLVDPAQPVPGGIDFSSLELRYLADVDAGQVVRYAMQAKVPTDGKSTGNGLKAAQVASDAFFVWLALPPATFRVNLNPNRADDILDAQFARTDAGRILLEADLALKKTTAALINPQTELGKRVWDSLRYAEGAKRCVSFRTWIEPGVATVRATERELYILDAPLSVQRESAYLHKHEGQVPSKTCPEQDPSLELHNEGVLQTMLLPKMLEVVNHAPEFQDLRSVYLSRVAAQWVRDRNARTPTVYSEIVDSGNIDRWPARQPWDPMEVFGRYVKSFNDKEFRVEEKTVIEGGRGMMITIRSYGGVNFTTIPQTEIVSEIFSDRWKELPATVRESLEEPTRDVDGRLWLGGTRPLAEATPEPWREPIRKNEPSRKMPLGLPVFVLIVVGWSLVILRTVRSKSNDPG